MIDDDENLKFDSDLDPADSPAAVAEDDDALALLGQGVLLVGKLAGMNRREAQQLIREHGGCVLENFAPTLRLVVIGEEQIPLTDAVASPLCDDDVRAAVERGDVQVITETQLWQRLGLVDETQHVHRLYTPAILADLLGVPLAVIRRWHRRGLIVPSREVRRLPYFDFQEVATARRLAEMLAAGVSPQAIEKQLAALGQLLPDVQRPLAQLSIIVRGKKLLLRQGEGLITTGGQRLLDFESLSPAESQPPHDPLAASYDGNATQIGEDLGKTTADDFADDASPPTIQLQPFAPADSLPSRSEMLQIAAELEDEARFDEALEVYRTALGGWGACAETCFRLAELLYRLGDLSAARERYFMAIELDEDYVEARANLGCVLAEEGSAAWAIAAFEGALALHAEYPDAHYHLARLLDEFDRADEAHQHWQAFLQLAPESPWAAAARERLAGERLAPASGHR